MGSGFLLLDLDVSEDRITFILIVKQSEYTSYSETSFIINTDPLGASHSKISLSKLNFV